MNVSAVLLFLIQNLRISKFKLSELEQSNFKFNISKLINNNSLILLFTINFYIISSIMSTKDIRFIMPIYPILCIYFAVIYNLSNINLFKFNLKKYLVLFSLTISFFLNNNPKFNLNSNSNFLQFWPHAQIIEQIEIRKNIVGEKGKLLTENLEVVISFYNENPISIELPNQVKCKIKSTDVALKGQTVSSSYKPATLDNGLNIQVPPFIEAGDEVTIDTRNLEYIKKN